MAAARSKKNDQVFDVSKPGKKAPSSTSRPLISSHGPMLQDPMVNQTNVDTKDKDDTPKTTSKKVITPLEDTKPKKKANTSEAKSEPEESKTSNTVETDKPSDKSSGNNQPETKPRAVSEPSTKQADEATVDIIAQQAIKDKNGGISPEDLERQNALEKHIEDKTYFVPIGQVAKRRNKRLLIFMLIALLLVAVAAGFFAAQTEILTIDIPV
ncbi:MAG: hypothetical protein U5K77_02975 [Candidatus Saccharibacteria bacterium]|nr:hypothetical protein [Candidatus Saccharibacteria bacterium]